jgi:uncharacterized membrane protein YeiH
MKMKAIWGCIVGNLDVMRAPLGGGHLDEIIASSRLTWFCARLEVCLVVLCLALLLFCVTKLDRPNSPTLAIGFLIGLVAVSILGACVGLVLGFFIARWFNQQVGWKHSAATSR